MLLIMLTYNFPIGLTFFNFYFENMFMRAGTVEQEGLRTEDTTGEPGWGCFDVQMGYRRGMNQGGAAGSPENGPRGPVQGFCCLLCP